MATGSRADDGVWDIRLGRQIALMRCMNAVQRATRTGRRSRAAPPPSSWRSAIVAASIVTPPTERMASGPAANRVSAPESRRPGIICAARPATTGSLVNNMPYRPFLQCRVSRGGLRSARTTLSLRRENGVGLFTNAHCRGSEDSAAVHRAPRAPFAPKPDVAQYLCTSEQTHSGAARMLCSRLRGKTAIHRAARRIDGSDVMPVDVHTPTLDLDRMDDDGGPPCNAFTRPRRLAPDGANERLSAGMTSCRGSTLA